MLVAGLFVHVCAYGSFWPADAVHGYLGWYEAAIGVASAAAVALLCILPVARLASRGRVGDTGVAAILRPPPADWPETTLRVGGGSLVLFALQETIEHSFSAGRPELVSLSATTWLIAVAAAVAVAGFLYLLSRGYRTLLGRAGRADKAVLAAAVTDPCAPEPGADRPRLSPLALRQALRAPPPLPA